MTPPCVRLEVRCCCQPQKLLGWLTVPYVVPGRDVLIKRPDGTVTALPVQMISMPMFSVSEDVLREALESLRLGEPVRMLNYPAIKAEGMTVDQLRDVPGFVAAREDGTPEPYGLVRQNQKSRVFTRDR